jgi:glycosyltransferase involved in cell wall biosynthesis
LPNWDVVCLDRFLFEAIRPAVFFLHAFLWGLYAAIKARSRNADVYYTRDSVVAYWLLRLGLPTIYEEHVVPKRAQRWLLRRMISQPSLRLVVVLTSFIKDRLVNLGFSEKQVVVRADGIDLTLFDTVPSKEACRRLLGLPEDCTIIGYVGRFQTMGMEKGIPELVHAMASLHTKDGSNSLLVCIGGPMDAVPEYMSLAREAGIPEERLKFIDHVPHVDVPFWIRAFDVAVAPFPTNEHYAYFMSPLKIFEYMAAGVPIVASDLPSIREVLQHGENAWLVEPGDGVALAAGITRVLNDVALRTKIAAEAERSAIKYSWARRAKSILAQVNSD